jgi:hypothetical protein
MIRTSPQRPLRTRHLLRLILVGTLLTGMAGASAEVIDLAPGPQVEHLRDVLHRLDSAILILQAVAHDDDGHREAALAACEEARRQVRLAIAWRERR